MSRTAPRRRFLFGRLLLTILLAASVPAVILAAEYEPTADLSPDSATLAQITSIIGVKQNARVVMAQARAIAASRPLEPAPFFIAAAVAASRGDKRGAVAFLEETVRRRVSFAPAHTLLAGHELLAGRSAVAIDHADLAMRVSSETRKTLIPWLLPQLYTSAGQSAIIAALDRAPTWRNDFISAAIQHHAPTDVLFAILNRNPAGADQVLLSQQRAMFINDLVASNEGDKAYLAWVSFLPTDSLTKVDTVYDGDFTRQPGPPPFNWALSSADGGYADYGDEGGPGGSFLDVRYSAPMSLSLAAQTLFLGPGKWRLSERARGSRAESGGLLRWRLECLPGKQEIGAIALDDISEDWSDRSADVTIPAEGCGLQQLSLIGLPGDSSGATVAQLRGVRMSRIDGR